MKGYGFIKRETGQDVFCHFSSIVMEGFKSPDAGQAVEFEVVENAKGLEARNLTPL